MQYSVRLRTSVKTQPVFNLSVLYGGMDIDAISK
jgi:hypothetical protein